MKGHDNRLMRQIDILNGNDICLSHTSIVGLLFNICDMLQLRHDHFIYAMYAE